MLVDSHCHLDFPGLAENIDQVIESMEEAGVGLAVCIGVSLERMPALMSLVEDRGNLFATVGVHPEQKDCLEPDEENLLRLASHPKVIGIGETGLDYHWHPEQPEWQRERFRTHIRAAKSSAKPLVIHMRNASEDTLRIMEEEGAGEAGGVMHCFTESLDTARKALDLGFHISFSGIVTFRNAREIKEVAKAVPLERILVETDSPYLAPEPHRGKPNQPAYVRHVAEEIACLKGIGLEEVARATTENFCRLFKVSPQ
ncbi:MAG TPA: TatD family hydrolase [Candidatus Desulfobacillus sp.]|nr:TatD family hydrolase [Candidatus Desulfobacillus sp.]